MMRLFNVALAVALFSALAPSGTRAIQRIQLFTLTAVMIPLGWFMIASVNPGGWAITRVSAFGFGLHSAFLVRDRVRLVTNLVVIGGGSRHGHQCPRRCSGLHHHRGDVRVSPPLARAGGPPQDAPGSASVVLGCAAVALSSRQVASIATPEPESTRSGTEVLVQLALNFPSLIGGFFGYSSWDRG